MGRLIPIPIFYSLIKLAIMNNFILWQVNKRSRSLDQLTFHIALARLLIDGYSSRKRKGRLVSLQFTCRNCGGGDRGRVAIYRPFGEVSLSLNSTVTCMVLKANDRRTSCPCHDEFRGPRSDYVRQVALATTTTTTESNCFKIQMIF
ncbi:uncharacterized protein TNCV_2669701 [Trichonephila clavipes]|nr:uncharacterized protein TNCV_2669701 [Trichonephila clavipes]